MRGKLIIAMLTAGVVLTACSGCMHTINSKDSAEYAESLTVSVTGGKITGATSSDGEVAVYKGVPYCAAPVGDLRWRAPQPLTEWEGELDCTKWGANAMQGDASVFSYWTEEFVQDTNPEHYRDGIVYSEDCLTLNIWSSYAVEQDKPVLVYIHGGGYNSGGASCEIYYGENIAKQDVVFVSIQYRVGALGFMATPALIAEDENGCAGNYGLLDQIAALKWVKKNISKFGGNPENVTVMGQSAGAGSVNALIASPLASGLFVNAVSASHNSISRDYQTVQKRCSELNLSYNGTKLSEMTCEQLRAIPSDWLKGKQISTGGPCIDGYALTKTFRQTVLDGEANDVTVMSGNVAMDDLIYSVYKDNSKDITVVDCMLALQNMLGKARISGGYTQKTYVYMFDYNVPKATSVSTDTTGARHSYELAYFLGNFSEQSGRAWTQKDKDLSKIMVDFLVSFCYTGTPECSQSLQWTENKGDYYFMSFSENVVCGRMSEAKTEAVENYYKLF